MHTNKFDAIKEMNAGGLPEKQSVACEPAVHGPPQLNCVDEPMYVNIALRRRKTTDIRFQ